MLAFHQPHNFHYQQLQYNYIYYPTYTSTIPNDLLEDILQRYIYHLTTEELENKIQVMFQLQYAYWFYMDECVHNDPYLVKMGEIEFIKYMVKHSLFLCVYIKNIDEALKEWKEYVGKIPVYGSILIDKSMTKCVLLNICIEGKYHNSFPKGKVDKNESPIECAIRETLEETGYNISSKIKEDCYISTIIKGKYVRLYLIFDVNTNYVFLPKTKGEIESINWYSIDNLPLLKSWKHLIPKIKETIHKETNGTSYSHSYSKYKKRKRWT